MRQQLTENDIKKIEAEIEDRKLNRRPKLIADLKEARSHGDLSENFEYYAAKREKNQNESRIRYLERLLRTSETIEDDSAEDEVGLNDTVILQNLTENEEETYKLTTQIRSNSLKGLLSIESPLGKALLHHKEGDEVEIHVSPEYSFEVKILSIEKSEDEDEEIKKY